jgi:hypothetical protein
MVSSLCFKILAHLFGSVFIIYDLGHKHTINLNSALEMIHYFKLRQSSLRLDNTTKIKFQH